VNVKGQAECMKAKRRMTYNGLTPEDGIVNLREEVVVRTLATCAVEDQECPSDKRYYGLASETLKIVWKFITTKCGRWDGSMALGRRSRTLRKAHQLTSGNSRSINRARPDAPVIWGVEVARV
jgi:hypothetical protein